MSQEWIDNPTDETYTFTLELPEEGRRFYKAQRAIQKNYFCDWKVKTNLEEVDSSEKMLDEMSYEILVERSTPVEKVPQEFIEIYYKIKDADGNIKSKAFNDYDLVGAWTQSDTIFSSKMTGKLEGGIVTEVNIKALNSYGV